MSKYSKYIFIIFLASIIAIVAGSLNTTTSPPSKYHLDKVIHFGAFAFLSILIPLFINSKGKLWVAISILIIVGGGIEIMQSYIDGREGSWADFFADILGIIAGVSSVLVSKKLWFKKL